MLLFIDNDLRTVNKTNKNTLSNNLLTTSNQLRSHFNMVYLTDNKLPVESTPSGQSNLVSVEYPCIRNDNYLLMNRPIYSQVSYM